MESNNVPSAHGYPISYELHYTTITCSCGDVLCTSRLFVIILDGRNAIGLKSKHMRPTGLSEPMYDLPIREIHETGGTARCARCIATTPRVPLPDNHRNLKASIGSDIGPTMRKHWEDASHPRGGSTTKKHPAPTTKQPLADILRSIKL
jgi:hypothetical protein